MAEQAMHADPVTEARLGDRLTQKLGEVFTRRNAVKALGAGALFLAGALPMFNHELHSNSTETNIASHDSEVTLTTDGYVTFDLGAHEPSLRIPQKSPLSIGLHIDAGPTNVDKFSSLTQRYSSIAAQPSGEIDKLHAVANHLVLDGAVKSGLVGLIGPGIWVAVGSKRRKELFENTVAHKKRSASVIAASSLVLAGCGVSNNLLVDDEPQVQQWTSLQSMYPELPPDDLLQKMQVAQNALTDKEIDTLRGAVAGYEKSHVFYKELAEKAALIGSEFRQPQPGDVVVAFIADRHDNIGMDPVMAALSKSAGAEILFDGGDDTSSGQGWEAFSLDSLIANSKQFKYRVVAPGNHDPGSFVASYLHKHGKFIVLDGKVTTVEGIRIIGLPDPRSSSFVNSASFASTSLGEQAQELADTTCKADENGKRISTVLTHESGAGQEALERGCVDLRISGHVHRFEGPDVVLGDNGKQGVGFTTDTAGGAALAMAAGPLRREAGMSYITYHDGIPIGIQEVSISQNGEITVKPFWESPAYKDHYGSEIGGKVASKAVRSATHKAPVKK